MQQWRFDYGLGMAFAAALIVALPTSARGAMLSEQLSRNIAEAQRAESTRQYNRALAIYGQVIETEAAQKSDELRLVLAKRAALYEQLNEYAKAEADLTAALQVEPVDPAFYAERAYFYMRHNRFSEALADFVTAARLQPETARFRYGAGRVQAALKNFAAAIEFYDEALRLDPKYSVAWLARAEAHVHLQMLSEAKADYERAIALGLTRPGDRFFAYLGRGYVRLLQGDDVGAISDFDQALALDPTAIRALLWQAFGHERRGRNDLAIAGYERVLAIDPTNRAAHQNLRRLRSHTTTEASWPHELPTQTAAWDRR